MNKLFELRERLQIFYSSYTLFINKGAQALFALGIFYLINSRIGYLKPAASLFVTLALACVSAFLPVTMLVVLAAVLVMAHLYGLSAAVLAAGAVILLLIYIFCLRMSPRLSWLLLVSIMGLVLKVPIVIPVAFGLLGMIGCSAYGFCGVLIYYFLLTVRQLAPAVKTGEGAGLAAQLTEIVKRFLANRDMWVSAAVVLIGTLVVYAIRTKALEHSWKVATGVGVLVSIIVYTAGNMAFEAHVPYVVIFLSAVLAVGVGLLLEFLFFSVDYKAMHTVHFEDDDYVYYVKAIPKIGIAIPSKKVKKIAAAVQEDMEENVELPDRGAYDGPEDALSAAHIRGAAQESKTMPKVEDIVATARDSEAELALTKSLSDHIQMSDKQ